jgi:hypothetical protein
LRLDTGDELGEFGIVEIPAGVHVGGELLVRVDPFLLEARKLCGEIAISLGVARPVAMRVAEHVLEE